MPSTAVIVASPGPRKLLRRSVSAIAGVLIMSTTLPGSGVADVERMSGIGHDICHGHKPPPLGVGMTMVRCHRSAVGFGNLGR